MKCKKERMRTRALLHSFPSSLALRLCRRNLSVLSIIYGRTCSARLFLAFSEGRILTAARPRERPFTATAAAAAAAGKKGKRDRADGSRGGIDRPSVRPSVGEERASVAHTSDAAAEGKPAMLPRAPERSRQRTTGGTSANGGER